MHSGSQHLFDIIILLSAAVFIVIAFWKMNISPVLGYFVAGALIGSHGFNLIHSAEVMDNFAEFGVVFLLFIIGLELTFERLIAMRRHVFGFGSLQVIVTMIAIWCIALAFGVSINMAAVIGGGLAPIFNSNSVAGSARKGFSSKPSWQIVNSSATNAGLCSGTSNSTSAPAYWQF